MRTSITLHAAATVTALLVFSVIFHGQDDASAAGPPPVEWARAYGGTGQDQITAAVATPDGGIVGAGASSSADGSVRYNRGKLDGWVIKLAPSGDIEWTSSIGGSGDDEIHAIALTSDGGYVVSGHSNSADGDFAGLSFHSGGSGFIARLDSLGRPLWTGSYFNHAAWSIMSVLEMEGGGFVFAGATHPRFHEESSCGDGGPGKSTLWLARTSARGELVQSRCFTLPGDVVDYSLHLYPDGGAAVTYCVDIDEGDMETGVVVSRIPADAPTAWFYVLPGKASKAVRHITPVPGGGYLISGNTLRRYNPRQTARNEYPWLFKLSESGKLQWQVELNKGDGGRISSVVPAGSGFFAVGHSVNQKIPAKDGIPAFFDFMAMGFNSFGRQLWRRDIEGAGWDSARAAVAGAGGGLYAAGSTGSVDNNYAWHADGDPLGFYGMVMKITN
ncbi:MAG: hypothetical protein LBT40_00355 [Deltaproteobacteria bacterium]|jgi:hypothetical protein|nr:hypothetical protein [Deltaproteobacteria bacterium]